MAEQLTYDRLHEVLHYGPVTGTFTRKLTLSTNAIAGQEVGTKKRGYIYIQIDGRGYQAHRLAWLYVHGYFPEQNIDHINRMTDDNRIANLREASQQCNMRNSSTQINNTSGLRGVGFHKQRGKWAAKVKVNGRNCSLGLYDDFDDAVCARLAAEQCLNWSGCDSTSSAYLYVQKMLGRSSE